MATASESSVQYERDLRSNNQDHKRLKDYNKKWAHKGWGHRPGAGEKIDGYWFDADVSTFAKVRPSKSFGSSPHAVKRNQNINKGAPTYDNAKGPGGLHTHKIHEKLHAMAEVKDAEASRSVIDLLPSPRGGRTAAAHSDGVLYSFDANESPATKVSLEVFVKPNAKETEKKVADEYGVVDAEGNVVEGKKAVRHLRKPASASPRANVEEPSVEVDGFELI